MESLDLSDDTDTIIENNGFFPDLSVIYFKKRFRITVAELDVICQNLESAMYEKNAELRDWVCTQQRQGWQDLESLLVQYPEYKHYYNTAVYAYAKALLLQQHRDKDTTLSGHHRADDLSETAEDYFDQSRKNINLLIGKPDIWAELL